VRAKFGPALALLALAGCGSEVPPERPAEVATATPDKAPDTAKADNKVAPALAIEAEGLRLFNKETGAARPIAFGTPRDDVLAMLAFRGTPETGTNEECGAGPLDYANWPDGLGLHFQDGKFAGWKLDERSKGAITTASGIGVGSSRTDLGSAYAAEISKTTLGTEFAAGELFGLLDGKGKGAKITNMWGGVSCNFG
jgi:hypothetical protein